MASLISPLLRSLRLGGASRRPFLYRFRSNERRDAITYISKNFGYYSTVGEALGVQYDESYDDNKVTEKAIALRQALSQLASDFGRESMLSLQRFSRSRRADVISTGLLKLDLALGIGGLPKGRIIEIYGRESSGKTSLALHIIREAQKQGGYCAYLDAENALNPLLLESLNLNLENLLIAHPDSAENLLSIVNTLAKSESVDVIVVDSVAALVPQFEIDHPIGGAYRDVQKQIMMQALRKISSSLGHSETIIIFLNQVRASVKSGKGIGQADEVTCGGNALSFYSAVRLRMIRKGALKTGDKITGVKLCVEVVKNKLGPAMKRAELGIKFGRGFCCESEVFELACEHGLIVKEGTKYMIVGRVFSDEHSAQHFLSENPELLHRMLLFLRRQLFDRQH